MYHKSINYILTLYQNTKLILITYKKRIVQFYEKCTVHAIPIHQQSTYIYNKI